MKVLFVDSTVIGENSPTGATLANITKGIPNCEFLQYCIDYDPEFHTPCFPTIYEEKKTNLLFYILKSIYRKKYAKKTFAGCYEVNVSTKGSSLGLIAKFLLDLIPHCLSKKAINKIKDFNPDVIYSLGGTITSLRMTYKLSEVLDTPVVLHIMDDWFTTKYKDCSWTRIGNRIVNRAAEKVLTRTRMNIGICEKMADHYSQKFSIPFSYAMNCIDEVRKYDFNEHERLRFVFSGGIHGGREESLYRIGKLIRETCEFNERINFEIYTSNNCLERYKKALLPVASLYEYVPKEKMFDNMGNADVLVHVESFAPDEIEYFRYSLSTKIPEYMSVGRPVLCYGPKDIATVSYIQKNNVGICAENDDEFILAITKLLNKCVREEIGKNAIRCAENEHLVSVVAMRVLSVFEKTVILWKA